MKRSLIWVCVYCLVVWLLKVPKTVFSVIVITTSETVINPQYEEVICNNSVCNIECDYQYKCDHLVVFNSVGTLTLICAVRACGYTNVYCGNLGLDSSSTNNISYPDGYDVTHFTTNQKNSVTCIINAQAQWGFSYSNFQCFGDAINKCIIYNNNEEWALYRSSFVCDTQWIQGNSSPDCQVIGNGYRCSLDYYCYSYNNINGNQQCQSQGSENNCPISLILLLLHNIQVIYHLIYQANYQQ